MYLNGHKTFMSILILDDGTCNELGAASGTPAGPELVAGGIWCLNGCGLKADEINWGKLSAVTAEWARFACGRN